MRRSSSVPGLSPRAVKTTRSNSVCSGSSGSRIRVVVRKRPLTSKELASSSADIISLRNGPEGSSLTVHEPKCKVDMTAYTELHHFSFDEVFDEASSNASVYEGSAAPLISRLFNGQSSTCFAYGATGAGKTHTMMGNESEPGLYILAARSVFIQLSNPKNAGLELRVSCYEIYGGKVFDLLHGRRCLPVREDGRRRVNVVGLKERQVDGLEAFKALLSEAAEARITAATGAHADSSRSHAILQLSLRRPRAVAATAARMATHARAAPPKLEEDEELGRFCFVDLAGTERGADTLSCDDKERRLEARRNAKAHRGAEINKSLLALKECIRGLDMGKAHVPFRGSKLTEVLRDSFVGDCQTCMIGAIAPAIGSVEQTLNTLRYAERVRAYSGGEKTERVPAGLEHSSSTARSLLLASPRGQRPVSARRGPPSSLASLHPPAAAPSASSLGGSMPVSARHESARRAAETPASGRTRSATANGIGFGHVSARETPMRPPSQLKPPRPKPPPPPTEADDLDGTGHMQPTPAVPHVAVSLEGTQARQTPADAPPVAASPPLPPLTPSALSEMPPQPPSLLVPAARSALEGKENVDAAQVATDKGGELRAVLDAHRSFVNDALETLDLHTFMLQQVDAAAGASASEYVGSLEALLKEKSAALAALHDAIAEYRHKEKLG